MKLNFHPVLLLFALVMMMVAMPAFAADTEAIGASYAPDTTLPACEAAIPVKDQAPVAEVQRSPGEPSVSRGTYNEHASAGHIARPSISGVTAYASST